MSAYKDNLALIDWSWVISLPEKRERRVVQRSDLACPMVVTDAMAPVVSAADGKMHDSKSSIRASYRAHGLTEVGNDPARLKPREKPKTDRRVIKEVIEKAAARYERGERSAT